MIDVKTKPFLALAILLLVLVGLPVTLFLTQQRQTSRTQATASTTLYLAPAASESASLQKNVGDPVSFDVMINPGTNLPSVVKLEILYDAVKLAPSATSPFAVNASAFPTTIEGPIAGGGKILISISIGSDATKAIQTVTKVGTLSFTALSPTETSPTMVSFGTRSQVLSLAPSDEATQNVLSTTTPGFVTIIAPPTPTPDLTTTPTLTPTAAVTPTATESSTPTPLPSPTVTPTPTPTPITGTALQFTVLMHGIGSSGDNANPNNSTMSNKTPQHPQRLLSVQVLDETNQIVASSTGTIDYKLATGDFRGTVGLGKFIPDGIYTVKIQSPSHLRRIIPGIQTISSTQTNTMPAATLVAGDINGDNIINIIDYNMVIGCYSDLLPAVSCDATSKLLTDLNDDTAVNQVDYNLFLREIAVQPGS